MWWGVPAPTLLLLGGVLGGAARRRARLACSAALAGSAPCRARRGGASARRSAQAVNDHVIGPVAAEMDALARCRAAASKAAA